MMSNSRESEFPILEKERVPCLGLNATLKEALDIMTAKNLGVCVFLDSNDCVIGLLTDGDLRRLILTRQHPLPSLLVSPALDFGSLRPTIVEQGESLDRIIDIMDTKGIWDVPIVNKSGKFVGIVNRHVKN